MKSTLALAMPFSVAVAVEAFANAHTNFHAVRDVVMAGAPQMPKSGSFTPQGCYSTAPNMTDAKLDAAYLSSGSCNSACLAKKFLVAALSPQSCYCGNTYPPQDDSIDLSKCNYPCNGFTQEACGGLKDAYSIFNLGIDLSPDTYGDSSSSPSSSTESTRSSSSPPATSYSTKTSSSTSVTSAAATAASTQTQNKPSPTPEKSSGSSVAATSASIVVGVVVAASMIAGIF
ncbi:hypothetical protein NQ176_g895 [Zarea fungicola]|uniref:Uncharacterized protein n=1 Tax=Zarea fungicola TaxID=93591 RepID=A0ACC1NVS2_9HYPO|nr:hypothetical protein NQ176_g895 [Lecanicillium fungicola]